MDAAIAPLDPDFEYFSQNGQFRARCRHCQMAINVPDTEQHKARCPERFLEKVPDTRVRRPGGSRLKRWRLLRRSV